MQAENTSKFFPYKSQITDRVLDMSIEVYAHTTNVKINDLCEAPGVLLLGKKKMLKKSYVNVKENMLPSHDCTMKKCSTQFSVR